MSTRQAAGTLFYMAASRGHVLTIWSVIHGLNTAILGVMLVGMLYAYGKDTGHRHAYF